MSTCRFSQTKIAVTFLLPPRQRIHIRRWECEYIKTFPEFQKNLLQVNEYRQGVAVAAPVPPFFVGRKRGTRLGVNQITARIDIARRGAERRVGQNAVAHLPAAPAADVAPPEPCRALQCVAQPEGSGGERRGASRDEQLHPGALFAQVADDPFGHAGVAAQHEPYGVGARGTDDASGSPSHGFAAAVEEALDVEVAAPRLVVEGLEEVAVIEQCEIHAVEGVERAVQVAVIALAGGCDVADDGFVLDAPQRHERHAHRVDDGRRMAYLAAVALRVPRQASRGRVVGVIVEQGGDSVVEVVEIPVDDARARLCMGGDACQEEQQGGYDAWQPLQGA